MSIYKDEMNILEMFYLPMIFNSVWLLLWSSHFYQIPKPGSDFLQNTQRWAVEPCHGLNPAFDWAIMEDQHADKVMAVLSTPVHTIIILEWCQCNVTEKCMPPSTSLNKRHSRYTNHFIKKKFNLIILDRIAFSSCICLGFRFRLVVCNCADMVGLVDTVTWSWF